jgi:hypothetical protein
MPNMLIISINSHASLIAWLMLPLHPFSSFFLFPLLHAKIETRNKKRRTSYE